MSRLLATVLAAGAFFIFMTSAAADDLNANHQQKMADSLEIQAQDHHMYVGETEEALAERSIPRPEKCKGKKDGFDFVWGAPHFCQPQNTHKCKEGEGTTYEDCLAVDKDGRQFQTGLIREVKCTVKCNQQNSKHLAVPQPPKNKCKGKQHGFRFEWGRPHACVPKHGKKCEVGEEGVTYRDCLAVKNQNGEELITSLNQQEKCRILSCPKKGGHDADQYDHNSEEKIQVLNAEVADDESDDPKKHEGASAAAASPSPCAPCTSPCTSVEGSYSFVGPDGVQRTVSFTACSCPVC